jgi:UDP-N-acetylglucosamine 2-epimerase (non-hydrolysing)
MTVVGTRPELIRLSLVFEALERAGVDQHLVHTGQNFHPELSDVFFEDLGIREPDAYLGVREAAVGAQIGEIIKRSEAELLRTEPDALLVLGDTNSGLSAIAAARRGVPVFHMEAGNRCFDDRVPEERNRKLIDHISDFLLPYTPRSREYLLREGIPAEKIFLSGNPITDVIERFRDDWGASGVTGELGVDAGEFALVTAHRQETVDHPARLAALCQGLDLVATELELPVLWSVHPRTQEKLDAAAFEFAGPVTLLPPLRFFDFVRLEADARLVITDSGTVQEECSLLGTPAVTCRDATERPETLECGSNVLSGVTEPGRLLACARAMLVPGLSWRSPYEGPAHTGVAERVAAYLIGQCGR